MPTRFVWAASPVAHNSFVEFYVFRELADRRPILEIVALLCALGRADRVNGTLHNVTLFGVV
jgi:hypothetical protein